MKHFLLIALVSLCLIPAAQAQDTPNLLENLKTLIGAANDGDLQAQWALAEVYHKGKDEIRDLEKAAEYYEMAAQQGFNPAAFELGQLYLSGTGVPKDEKTAMVWFIQAADKGNEKAQIIVGIAYRDGTSGLDKNWKKAVQYFKMACTLDNSEACYEAGSLVAQNDAYDKAEPFMVRAAQLGHTFAQLELAYYYQEPRPGVQDLKKSKYWFRKAMDAGIAEAKNALWMQDAIVNDVPANDMEVIKYYKSLADDNDPVGAFHMGWMYRDGIAGQQKNFAKAEDFLKAAAEQGHQEAQFMLAQLYFFGSEEQNFPAQSESALEWLNKAADAGFPQAVNFLAECYINGIIVEADTAKAIALLQRIANQNAMAQSKLGLLLLDKAQTAAETAEAAKIVEKAAVALDPFAQQTLALLYREGRGVEQNDIKSFVWMKRAAMQDLPLAQANLALYYQNGIGTLPSKRETLYWWEQAARLGHEPSMLNLASSLLVANASSEDKQRGLAWLMVAEKMGSQKASDLLDQVTDKISKDDWTAAKALADKSL